jgi:hypothetical protein
MTYSFPFLLVFIYLVILPLRFQIIQEVEVLFPQTGDVLQGMVSIIGTTNISGFQSTEISFSYQDTGEPDWFVIFQGTEPVHNGTLTLWDTTTIADGTYLLKVRVLLNDGSFSEQIIRGLRVRNYSPVETVTAFPTDAGFIDTSEPVMSIASNPTGTALPPNPGELTRSNFYSSIITGVFCAGGVFCLFGGYFLFRIVSQRQ